MLSLWRCVPSCQSTFRTGFQTGQTSGPLRAHLMTSSVGLVVGLSLLLGTPALGQGTLNFPTIGEVTSSDPSIVDPQAKIEVIASGYDWVEGPVWVQDAKEPHLLFSEIPSNTVLKWVPGKGVSVFLKPSGYTGVVDYGKEPGSNGLALDREGRLVSAEHGDRRISVLTKDGGKLTLADKFEGKRFNSPNDLVVKSNGDIYFTDPPYGLPKQLSDPRCEMDFCGVYRVSSNGNVTLLTKELTRPNGIAFSPDEKTLYVPQSDPKKPVLMAFTVLEDGTLGPGKVLYDFSAELAAGLRGLPDGMDVDKHGNIFCTGPGGVYVLTSEGKVVARINTGENTSNCKFGGPDRSMLYITSDMYVCRIQTKTSK